MKLRTHGILSVIVLTLSICLTKSGIRDARAGHARLDDKQNASHPDQAVDPKNTLEGIFERGPLKGLSGLSPAEQLANTSRLQIFNDALREALELFPHCKPITDIRVLAYEFPDGKEFSVRDLDHLESIRRAALNVVFKDCRIGAPAIAKVLAEQSPVCGPVDKFDEVLGLDGFGMLALQQLYGYADSDRLPAPGFLATAENLSDFNFTSNRARAYEVVDPDLAARWKERISNYRHTQETKGRDPHQTNALALTDSMVSLVADFSSRQKLSSKKEVSKFVETALAATQDPQAYRRLKIGTGDCAGPLMFSMEHVLSRYEAGLDETARSAFQQLRREYGLGGDELERIEAEYAHGKSQFAIGGILTDHDKRHNLPTQYVDFKLKDGKPFVRHETPAEGGWVVTVARLKQGRSAQESLTEANRRHEYAVHRTVDEYAAYFDPSFQKALNALTAQDHVIDMGSGEGLFLEALGKRTSDAPWTTGATLQMKRENPFKGDRNRYFEEDLFKLSDEQLLGQGGKAKVITDVFGVFSYVEPVEQLLERYFSLLADDGTVNIVYAPTRNHFALPNGEEVDFRTFLESKYVRGIIVESHHVDGRSDGGIILRKKKGEIVDLPKLKLKSAVDGDPPDRVFAVVE